MTTVNHYFNDDWKIPLRKPARQLKVIIVGAGTAGLSTAIGMTYQERDEKICQSSKGLGNNPDLWAGKEMQQWLWGTDIMKETVLKWPEWRARVRGSHSSCLNAVAYSW